MFLLEYIIAPLAKRCILAIIILSMFLCYNTFMKKLYYLIGYPASGKTTLAKKLKETGNYDYVSTDDAFDALYKQGLKYSEILAKRHILMVSMIISKGQNCPNIILDTYTPHRKERAKILALVPSTYEKIAVIMDTDKDECIRRFNKRAKLKKDNVPVFAHETIEDPIPNEFDQIIKSSDLFTAPKVRPNLTIGGRYVEIAHLYYRVYLLSNCTICIMKTVNTLILKRILKQYDEIIEHDLYSDYVFRIRHVIFQNFSYYYLTGHEAELCSFLQKSFNLETCVLINIIFYPSKFLVIRIKKEKR